MTSPPSPGPGHFHIENLGLDRGRVRHGQCFRNWARSVGRQGLSGPMSMPISSSVEAQGTTSGCKSPRPTEYVTFLTPLTTSNSEQYRGPPTPTHLWRPLIPLAPKLLLRSSSPRQWLPSFLSTCSSAPSHVRQPSLCHFSSLGAMHSFPAPGQVVQPR